ncbi:MAG: EAL domain-containing protein [Pseudonocardiales bacterium]|nr:EAL domain-containing protein [Pseudonocardiales bacterium]MBV9028863.1 EAL domain-containing protein [Pseudonocardiales bacterium]MBW0008548.1 EAL domain-containing protein [Pseudonocardiales bacterium]
MTGPAQPVSQAELTRVWLDAVSPTAEVPMVGGWVEECLRDQLSRLVDALGREPLRLEPAADVGTELVARGFTGEQSLGRTVEILGHALPRLPELHAVEGLADKVMSLLAALASGYAAALRHRTRAERDTWFWEVFDTAPVGMVISRLDGTVTETNRALTAILHYPPAGLTGHDLSELFHPTDAVALRTAYRSLTGGRRDRFQCRVKALTGHGDTTWVALAVSVLRDAVGSPAYHVTMVQDVADQQLLEQRVRHQSLHDLLTGLPNRLHFASHLDSVLERDRNAALMLCKIDLDCFAVVNEGLGLGFGDFLLRSVATRLQSLLAEERAFVARFDDDEFAVLIEESPSTPNAATLAARINTELSEPVYLAGHGLAVSACMGIVARRTAMEADAKELIRAAEATLHRARRTGRGQWGLFDPSVDAEERARYVLATAMPEAWENGQVTLCYQPLVRLDPAASDAGRTVALAALLRWEHPERGVVGHEDCLALAEQTGLVLTLGPWMLRQACEQLRGWRDRLGVAVPPVRVDLTTYLTQDPDLVAVVRDALAAARLRPEDIQLGMPVEVIVAGHGDAVDNVVTLADIGVRTVLIRYGQALGNLVLLESLPVQGVEMAGPLVRAAARTPDSVVRAAVAGMVPLIRRTGTAVVVAGIDDTEQVSWWRDAGADSARGAALAPPVAPQDVPALLR